MSSSEDRNSAAGKSERRWSSDPLRASKRRSGSKRHFRPKTTYIDSKSFDLQALDAEKSLALRHDVLRCIQTESSDPKEIVVQFQECLQLTPAGLKNPEPETQRWIRYLANEAKSQNRSEIIEYLRTIVPAGTTGPLLDENLDVRCIPFKIRKEITVELSGGDEWKQLAENFGMSYNEIRLLDKRTFIPCDVVLDLIANHRYLIVGELYDRLVKSGLPGSADLL